jgi:hypothetical protein
MKRLNLEQKIYNEIRAKHSFEHNLKRKNKKRTSSFNENNTIFRFTYPLHIEAFCLTNHIHTWGKRIQNSIRLDDSINLFDNPEKVIRTLLEILYNARYYRNYPTLNFNGKRAPFGTLYLIDNLCWEVARKRSWGFHYKDMNISDASMLSKLRSFYSSEFENEKVYMLNEKVIINRSDAFMANQQYRVKSKEITDLVIRGVRENLNPDFQLSAEGYQAISSTIGEHFDNIILHAPNAEFGYLCGFYDKERKEVHILIYNFGKTIAETIVDTKLPAQIKAEIDTVIVSHTKNKFLTLLSSSFTEENALTLLALQEGISSRLEYDRSRGHGLMDFIEHCFELNPDTKITLISGRTAINIDKKYRIKNNFFIDRNRRILAFNENNDIYKKPDPDYVKNLAMSFPGLIIETIIPLTL